MNDDVVYLTRHGARIDSEDSDWLNKCNHNRCDDPHLSQSGIVGAEELAKRIKVMSDESISVGQSPIMHIISSPYIRCVETASKIGEALNLPIKIEPGIAFTSRKQFFLDADELKQQFPSVDLTYKPIMTREDLPIEYSDGACAHRSACTVRKVRSIYSGPILFVGHGASCLGIAGEFGHRGYVGYTSITKFIPCDGGKYKVDGLFGDVGHLTDQQTALNSAW